MTDKEKLDNLVAEIERLYNQSLADENRQAELGLKSAACTSYGKSKVCKELLSFIDSMQEEPVSEDLEKAANEYAKDYLFTLKPQRAPNIHFINGANWQKEQMMAKAVDAVVKIDAGGYPYIPQIELYDYDKDIPLAKEGEKVMAIIIKEE